MRRTANAITPGCRRSRRGSGSTVQQVDGDDADERGVVDRRRGDSQLGLQLDGHGEFERRPSGNLRRIRERWLGF